MPAGKGCELYNLYVETCNITGDLFIQICVS